MERGCFFLDDLENAVNACINLLYGYGTRVTVKTSWGEVLYQSPIWVWNLPSWMPTMLLPKSINLLYGYGTTIFSIYKNYNIKIWLCQDKIRVNNADIFSQSLCELPVLLVKRADCRKQNTD